MNLKHLKIKLLVMVFTIAILAGCGAGAAPDTQDAAQPAQQAAQEPADPQDSPAQEAIPTIQVLTVADELPIVNVVVGLYNQLHGGEVEVISTAFDQAFTQIMTAVMAGAAPDVIPADIIWISEFFEQGIIISLEDFITDEQRRNILPAFVDGMTADGHLVALPFIAHTKWLYYNRAMLQQAGFNAPPTTWDELWDMGETIRDQGLSRHTIAWAATQAEGLVCDWGVVLHASGGSWRDNAGQWVFNNPNGVAGLSLIVDSIMDGRADPASVTYNDRDTLNPFMAGDIPFVLNWAFAYALTNDETESRIAGDVGVALVPSNAPGVTSASITGGGAFAITTTSDHKDLAWKFVELFAGREVQEYVVTELLSLPIYGPLYDDEALTNNFPWMREMIHQFEYAVSRPGVSSYNEWSHEMQIRLHEAVMGIRPVQEVLDEMVSVSEAFS